MRILLTSNASYDPPRGGSTRSNLVWLRQLAQAGHQCRVVSAAIGEDTASVRDGIAIRGVRAFAQNAAVLGAEIREVQPDWVLVSSEDVGHVLLREAAKAAPGRIVYLAHTPQFLPFGPESWHPDAQATELVGKSRAIVVIGEHMAGYVKQHSGFEARVIHPQIYGHPPFPALGGFDSPLVLMINPCEVKGIRIFLALAARFPKLHFAGLNGWGTTTADREAMAALPNVRLLQSVPSIDDVLSQARLLLMPSVWYEGFGLIAMEAMLRGLPVIASDSGGLMEAKRGTGYVIPVRPVERYTWEFDEVYMPKAVVAEQDIEPWAAALERLTTDRAEYESEARRSRAAGLHFVSGLDASGMEKLLQSLAPAEAGRRMVEDLTPEQRALLLQRLLRQRGRLN